MIKPNKNNQDILVGKHFFKKRILILCCLMMFSATNLWAQSGKLFNTDTQLSSDLVTQVYQDTNGFIWIATRNGLNVYDGYNFTIKKKDANDKHSLNTNYINCIAQDQEGYLLLGTNKGLLLHDGQQFINIPLVTSKGTNAITYVTDIYKLHNGNILVTTSGYGIYIMKKGERTCKQIKETEPSLKYTGRAVEDHQGNIWFTTEKRQDIQDGCERKDFHQFSWHTRLNCPRNQS